MGHPKDPPDWDIKRNRDEDKHIDACVSPKGKGYVCKDLTGATKNLSDYSNIHHIVCISCMADGTIDGYVTDSAKRLFIEKCLKITDWNINARDNVVGLPKKLAYVEKPPEDWDGWACHQVDHDRYLERVSDFLNRTIWTKLQAKAEACKTDGKLIADQLNKSSTHWLAELSGRCTALAWKYRFFLPDRSPNELWFWPFSMYKDDARPRKPPPDWTNNPGMVGKLSQLFEKIPI